MNETEKAKAALAGIGGGENTGAEGAANNAQSDELEKLRHAKDVWAGRAKQYQEEKKALEEKLRKLESGQVLDDALKSLSEDDRRDTPDEYLGASGKVAMRIVDKATASQSEEIARLRAEMAERDSRQFLANIGSRHRDFFDSVQPGGDKKEYWDKYVANNRETFEAVMATRDEARFENLVNGFYRELGIPVSGAGASASPTPSTTGGPSPAGYRGNDNTVMTTDQYLKELERAEDMRRQGNMKEYREINDRLKRALNEGRVQ